MDYSKIAVRYAKALFDLGVEQNQLEELKNDMMLIGEFCRQSDFLILLESPVIKTSDKKKVFSDLFKTKIGPTSLKFMLMVANNRREEHLSGISRNFIDLYRSHKGIKAAKVISAMVLDEQSKQKISDVIAKLFKTEVELSVESDPDIIGGFILRVGDQQLDASVSTKLSWLKRDFLNTTI